MERMSANPTSQPYRPPLINSQTVEGLLGANATRHVLYLLDGQYVYQSQHEDGSIHYKFLSAQAVRLAFSHEPVDSGWLPPQLCRWGYAGAGQWAVMFIPPARHSLWLTRPASTSDEGQQLIQNEPGRGELVAGVPVPLPGLVFAGVGQHYYLWAVKTRGFNPEGIAYQAPLPNVYPDGRICWGTNQVGSVTAQSLTEAWKLFISSPFNSHLATGKSKVYPENVLPRLEKLGATSRKSYPVSDLLPLRNQWEREGWMVDRLVERLITSNKPAL